MACNTNLFAMLLALKKKKKESVIFNLNEFNASLIWVNYNPENINRNGGEMFFCMPSSTEECIKELCNFIWIFLAYLLIILINFVTHQQSKPFSVTGGNSLAPLSKSLMEHCMLKCSGPFL